MNLNGLPLFSYPLKALEESQYVNRIFSTFSDTDGIQKNITHNMRHVEGPDLEQEEKFI